MWQSCSEWAASRSLFACLTQATQHNRHRQILIVFAGNLQTRWRGSHLCCCLQPQFEQTEDRRSVPSEEEALTNQRKRPQHGPSRLAQQTLRSLYVPSGSSSPSLGPQPCVWQREEGRASLAVAPRLGAFSNRRLARPCWLDRGRSPQLAGQPLSSSPVPATPSGGAAGAWGAKELFGVPVSGGPGKASLDASCLLWASWVALRSASSQHWLPHRLRQLRDAAWSKRCSPRRG